MRFSPVHPVAGDHSRGHARGAARLLVAPVARYVGAARFARAARPGGERGGGAMPIIDADAHVIETERTWSYMDPADRKYCPQLVLPKDGSGPEMWVIDG